MPIHNIAPVFDKNSEILILGSFPSVKSRKTEFFYGHPQNRFWKVLSGVFEQNLPCTIQEKKDFLIRNHIAVWDVIGSCEIVGSSDSSIKNVIPNDLSVILSTANITAIYVNGGTAYKFYKKYIGDNAIKLPSTSPANAAYSVDRLIQEWDRIKKRI